MTEQPHIYGAADEANRDPAPTQGMRGERTALSDSTRRPELSHAVTLENGKRVVVSENSGVAYAEATGRAGRVAPEPEPEPEPEMIVAVELDEPRRSRLPVLLAAIVAGVFAGLFWTRRRHDAVVVAENDRPTAEMLLLPAR